MLAQPSIIQLSVDPARWQTTRVYAVRSRGWTLVVAPGYVYDLASVPRLLWWLIAPFELSCAAALIHDRLYGAGGLMRASNAGYPSESSQHQFTRAEADAFLYDIAAQEGVWWWRRWLAYKAVRLFGGRYFGNP